MYVKLNVPILICLAVLALILVYLYVVRPLTKQEGFDGTQQPQGQKQGQQQTEMLETCKQRVSSLEQAVNATQEDKNKCMTTVKFLMAEKAVQSTGAAALSNATNATATANATVTSTTVGSGVVQDQQPVPVTIVTTPPPLQQQAGHGEQEQEEMTTVQPSTTEQQVPSQQPVPNMQVPKGQIVALEPRRLPRPIQTKEMPMEEEIDDMHRRRDLVNQEEQLEKVARPGKRRPAN